MNIFKTYTFRWWEMSLFKISMLSFGIILAIYFYDYLVGLLWLWWVLFIASIIYLFPKVIREK